MKTWIAFPDENFEIPEIAFNHPFGGYKSVKVSAPDETHAADLAYKYLFKNLNCPFVLVPYTPQIFVEAKEPALMKKIKTPEGEILPL